MVCDYVWPILTTSGIGREAKGDAITKIKIKTMKYMWVGDGEKMISELYCVRWNSTSYTASIEKCMYYLKRLGKPKHGWCTPEPVTTELDQQTPNVNCSRSQHPDIPTADP